MRSTAAAKDAKSGLGRGWAACPSSYVLPDRAMRPVVVRCLGALVFIHVFLSRCLTAEAMDGEGGNELYQLLT